MKVQKGLVSIVMPIYNEERFVKEAIDSVLCQTYSNWELIIVDDGSNDRTAEILANFQDNRIQIFRHKRREGVVKSLNEGVALARGEFIARMDGDDICREDRISKQVEYLRLNPKIGIIGSFIYIIDEVGHICGEEYFLTLPDEIRNFSSRMRVDLQHPAIMVRAEILKAHPYREEFETAEDYELLARLSEKYECANIPEKLLYYRRHRQSISASRRAFQEKTAIRIIEEMMKRRGLWECAEGNLVSDWHNKTFMIQYYKLLSNKRVMIYASEHYVECIKNLVHKIEGCKILAVHDEIVPPAKVAEDFRNIQASYIIVAAKLWYPMQQGLFDAGLKRAEIIYGFFCKKVE